ncbi:MAG: DUF2298 domain-containing protein, partial [Halovenus sp.]
MEVGLVALWLGTYLALLVIGFVITSAFLPHLPDRGAGIAIPVALAILWLVTYVVGRVSIVAGLWAGIAVLAILAVVARFQGGDFNRSIYVETAAIFTAAFLFMIAIRAVDPAIHPGGGEKFLDFGLLKSLLRSQTLPPEDVWFAGEQVRYYYGGHLLASLLARLTDTSGRFAYNLAHAGFYAMLVTAAFGLARSVAADLEVPSRSAGLLAAFFVGIASNLLPAAQVVVLALPDAVSEWVATTLGFELAGLSTGLSAFNYWTASRVIPGTINEFPFFAWLNGDMHAHMTSTPFLLLGATLLYGYYRTPADRIRRRLSLLVAVGPIAALLAVVNTWSFPTMGGLTVLTVAFAPASPVSLIPASLGRRFQSKSWLRSELSRYTLAMGAGIGVLAIGGLVSLPFWLSAAGGQRGIEFLPERSGLGVLLVVHGAFLLGFVLYYYRFGRPVIDKTWVAAGGLAGVTGAALLTDAPAVALFGPLIVVGWVLARINEYESVPSPGYEAVLIVGGAGLALLVEFVFVQEQAGPGRMNTVFKVYMQVWVLWATALGVVVIGLLADRRPRLALNGPAWRRRFGVLLVLLVVGTSIYAGLAMADHLSASGGYAETEDPTLDGLAFVETFHPEEAPAIHWLDQHSEGQPNMVSKPGTDIYRWVNAPSSLTGIPTVAGWIHEIGYRGTAAYWNRVEDVETIFSGSPERQRHLLAVYDVEYVYVGPLERQA